MEQLSARKFQKINWTSILFLLYFTFTAFPTLSKNKSGNWSTVEQKFFFFPPRVFFSFFLQKSLNWFGESKLKKNVGDLFYDRQESRIRSWNNRSSTEMRENVFFSILIWLKQNKPNRCCCNPLFMVTKPNGAPSALGCIAALLHCCIAALLLPDKKKPWFVFRAQHFFSEGPSKLTS